MANELVSLGLACADVMVKPVDTCPERGKLSLVPQLEMHMGGLAAVTATVFSKLGGNAAFMGKLGDDGFGDYLLQDLQRSGVDTTHVCRVAGKGSASTVVLVSADGERSFLHHPGAAAELGEVDVDWDAIKKAKILHWGGPAVTPGLDGEPIGRVLRQAKEIGLMTSMDTCYDGTGLWFNRIKYALPHLDIVMSSIEEARQYTGKQTPEEIADFYRSFGPDIVLVKLGAEGLYVKSAQEAYHIPAHHVVPIDTTGAGDAACGGLLFGIINKWNLKECARLANAVGALTVQAMGGAEGVRSLEQALTQMNI